MTTLSEKNKPQEKISLSQQARKKIDASLKKYPDDHKESAVLDALMIVQAENNGWLTEALMNAVADYLEMPRIAVYEVATFYSMFELKPVGKYKLEVCTNISCMLCGSNKIVNHLERRLNVKLGETTHDGKFSLRGVECLGACGGAPMMMIGDQYHENLTPEKIEKILEELK